MTRRKKQSTPAKKGKADLFNAHNAVQKFLEGSEANKIENEDPRFQNITSRPVSRKERRKQEREAKKARKRAFHSNKNGAVTELVKANPEDESPTTAEKSKHSPVIDKDDQGKQQKLEAVKSKAIQRERRKKLLEDRRKQDLLEANQIEDRNIKRLEKSLRFRKKKKTKEVIIPGQFKYDGLDYLLDIVDSKKLEALKEEDDELAQEMDLEQVKDRQKKLADHLGDDGDDGSDEDSEEDSGGEDEKDFGDEGEHDMNDMSNYFTKGLDEPDLEEAEEEEEEEEENDDISDEDVSSIVQGQQSGERSEAKNLKQEDEGRGNKAKRKRTRKDDENQIYEDINESKLNAVEDEDEGYDQLVVNKTKPKMDPYGYTPEEREFAKSGSYIPPHKRAMMMGENLDSKRKAELEKLKRQLKGLINRLSSANVLSISRDIENLYQTKSRNDMNESLCNILQEALIINTMSGDRLVMEAVLLISILHYNVGSEVGAHFLQSMAVKFDELHKALQGHDTEDKSCDNALLILIHMYNFKIVHCCLIYDIIRRLINSFTEQDIEMLLLILKSAGMSLRKDDPLALKEIILLIQEQSASSSEEFKQRSRAKYMLETITALRNNDIRKMAANNNLEHLDTLRKTLRNLTKHRVHSSESNLRIPLDDLLAVDQKGRWWIVGSAWTGRGPNRPEEKTAGSDSTIPAVQMDQSTSVKIMELSRQQRMNTDLRRSIFGLVMTAEIACQFAYWDRFKSLDQLSKSQLSNLSSLFAHLVLSRASSLSVLKVVEFADMDKNTASFLKKLLVKVLEQEADQVKMVFKTVSGKDKLSHLRDTISLFLHHFILKQRGARTDEEQQGLRDKINLADRSMKGEKEGQILRQ
ncbi:putative nucleolar MIF4G domain-containing protein 1 isoform X3 [Apostichopus japonicus]|uniref:Putative nucleolar MIF4G domain-containing protein 1 isoform X3 n=1 Tax=Stichopus japonicus TaxID=307972 RepID=A0A2G8LQG8_STIJA|nr:putative nucleolar MIF4G domain-containing protein 1 isoform X3 [Apostichopus japonicus]